MTVDAQQVKRVAGGVLAWFGPVVAWSDLIIVGVRPRWLPPPGVGWLMIALGLVLSSSYYREYEDAETESPRLREVGARRRAFTLLLGLVAGQVLTFWTVASLA